MTKDQRQTKTSTIIANHSYDQMLIVEKYERVVAYLYPIAQNLPRKHGVVRDLFLKSLLNQVELFIVAGKSNQISRLYQADSGLSVLRFWLRFLNKKQIRGITDHQLETAQVLIGETGNILGSWILRQKSKKG